MNKHKKYLSLCVIYGIVALICLLDITRFYPFFICLALISGMYGVCSFKYRNTKAPKPNKGGFIGKAASSVKGIIDINDDFDDDDDIDLESLDEDYSSSDE